MLTLAEVKHGMTKLEAGRYEITATAHSPSAQPPPPQPFTMTCTCRAGDPVKLAAALHRARESKTPLSADASRHPPAH